MKLRIRENSIRLRLTQSEVKEFAENGLVENQTEFSHSKFVYALKSSETIQNLQASFENKRLEIIVPRSVGENWIKPAEVGISGSDGLVKIMIEKDFACLTVRQGEDQSDAFPHPKEHEQNC